MRPISRHGNRVTRSLEASAAFSALEAILVVAGLVLVTGSLIFLALPSRRDALDSVETRRRLVEVREAIREFYADTGRLPRSGAEGLRDLVEPPKSDVKTWRGPYLNSTQSLEDAWGRAFEYADVTDAESGPQILLSSRGLDGLAGTEDDLAP